MPSPLARIRDLAEGQWGLVTLQQARAAGVAWRSVTRLVEAGLLERVAHGVYRVRGAAQADHLDLRAAWLQLDPAHPAWQRLDDPDVAVVSHASAASLYGVGDLRADVHEFTLSRRRQTRRPEVRIHRGSVPQGERVLLGGLPTTRAGSMIGQLLADHVDVDAVAEITREVLERVLDYPGVVAEAVAPYAGRFGLERGDGIGLLDELLRRAGTPNREALIAEARQP
jgi:Transcriptional regulator, AbiEi antitoxin